MSEYVILTESSCDMSPELVTEADVEVLPLSFTIDGTAIPVARLEIFHGIA